MISDLLIPLVAVAIAELGDKTQLAVLALSTKTKEYSKLLAGVFFAFLLADGIAVLLGDYISNFVPMNIIKIISGALFIIFGIFILFNKDEGEEKVKLKTPFLSSFTLVFFAEIGDKTQIASALFGAKYNALLAFLGVMIALMTLSVIAIYVGNILIKKVNQNTINKSAGAIFIILGIFCFI